jgi:hypothetical protein
MPREKGKEIDIESLKEKYKKDIKSAADRINELNSIIPQLEREKQQLVGMISVMQSTLKMAGVNEDKQDESETDRDK